MSKSISQLRGNQMISEAKEPASPDEKDMALRQANFILDFAEDLVEHLEDDGDFPEWMQNKLSAIHEKAKDLYASIEGSYDDEDEDEDEDEEDMKESYSLKEEVTFQVDVDGLPTMYVKAKSPSEVKASLRKIVKQPGMIQNVTRIPDAEVKKIFRDKAQGKEEVEEGAKGYKPGWMLKADPKLGAAVKAKQDLNKKRQATYGNPSAGKSVKEEAEQVGEAVDKSSDVYKEYLGLKKSSLKELRDMIKLRRKVVDVSGYDKQGAISYLLRSRYGDKAVAAALGLKEGVAEGSLDDIENTRQFRNAIALAKSQKTIRQAKHGKNTKFYADGTPVTPKEIARRAAERKTRKEGVAEAVKKDEREVDELSQNTLRQYHGKSALDIRKKRDQLNKGTLSTADHKKAQKRVQGINRAANKMEEVEQVDEAMKFSDKQIKMAYGIINDPRYKGGNMTAIVKKIEQIARGLSKHDGVQKAIQATNESTAAYGKSLEKEKEKRLTPSDRYKLSKIRAMLDKEKKK